MDLPVVRIVIADDHPIFRDGLRRLLESEPGLEIVGEARDGAEAARVVQQLAPDLLLLDLAMPDVGGITCLAELQEGGPRVIVLTAAITDQQVAEVLALGASGVILKESATRQLLDGIRRVMAGGVVVGEQVVGGLVTAMRRRASPDQAPYTLTPREREIVDAVVSGMGNREIASQLGISVQTVKHHLTSIFDKTGVSSRLELAMLAVRRGLASGD